MECNKDEAARAKEIAETNFTENNYAVAKKFILKAKTLYPGLEGLSQMLTTLDVYISADNKIVGESDWYGILGASPLDDDETIRKQYRKLALVLHPDKNKAIGAEGAFKLVSEAWGLLSDKGKRLAYNQKRNLGGFQHKVPTRTGVSTMNGYQNPKKNATSHAATTQQNNVRASFAAAPPVVKKNDTFWTICNGCKTHYEYMRMYLNHTLLCPNCHEAFVALEKDPPPNVFKQSNWSSRQSNSNTGHASASNAAPPPKTGKSSSNTQNATTRVSTASNSLNKTNFQWGQFSQTGDHSSASAAAQASSLVQQASEKIKRQREESERSHPFAERLSKKSSSENNHLNGNGGGYVVNGMAMGNGGFGSVGLPDVRKGSFEANRIFGMSNIFMKPNSVKDLSCVELRNLLMHKSKTQIRKKLQQLRSSSAAGTTVNKDSMSKMQKRVAKDEKENSNVEEEVHSTVAITVPDSDFHNFDLDRAENSFKEDQVWAAYDDDDGMPRFYARIHKVISYDPFRMRISWLNSRSNSELGPLDWICCGFTKTSGEFRLGKHERSGTLNSFSHKVSWEKGPRGLIRIYPKKGEVWALYKNWSSEWNEKTPDDVIHKYEMVEVVESFDEERGSVSVVRLHKVPGFKTVFRSNSNEDPKEVRLFPREELFRLSHQVPYHVLTGEEADNAPKGCMELDPAATPLELIQTGNKEEDR